MAVAAPVVARAAGLDPEAVRLAGNPVPLMARFAAGHHFIYFIHFALVARRKPHDFHPAMRNPTPRLRDWSLVIWTLLSLHSRLSAGDVYFTGFESPPFATGNDKIIGTQNWTGSHAGLGYHGIMTESEHQVLGFGNAAYLGGNYLTTTTDRNVWLWYPVNLTPVASNQEIVTFSLNLGIMDSSSTPRRDNFEIHFYNNATTPTRIGLIQFDNSSLDSGNRPYRYIWRSYWNTANSALALTNTNLTFYHQSTENLQVRINFRTNKWTATLGSIPLFQDQQFYNPTAGLQSLSAVRLRMYVQNSTQTTPVIYLPGDNYMLFDDYAVRAEPITTVVSVAKTATGQPKITWNEEAGYKYLLQWSLNCSSWSDLGTTRAPATTADFTYTDTTTPVPVKRFYRVKRTYP
jgi:hypothetical protein